jgi:ADP-ribosyl-[dinitrogen reductase] hydrolase
LRGPLHFRNSHQPETRRQGRGHGTYGWRSESHAATAASARPSVEALRKWGHAMSFKGTCLCRGVQYAVDRLDMLEHCHCRTCRKAHASAYATTAGVLREHFRWIAGEQILGVYESSPGKLRRFCSRCGTHVVDERPAQPHVFLCVATLDDDPKLRPALHIWTSHDVPWLSDDHELPRYPKWKPGKGP